MNNPNDCTMWIPSKDITGRVAIENSTTPTQPLRVSYMPNEKPLELLATTSNNSKKEDNLTNVSLEEAERILKEADAEVQNWPKWKRQGAGLEEVNLDKNKVDPFNPSYYTDGKIECIDVIESWGLPFHLGAVLKYIKRHGKKPGVTAISDLKKARWYLDRFIQKLEE